MSLNDLRKKKALKDWEDKTGLASDSWQFNKSKDYEVASKEETEKFFSKYPVKETERVIFKTRQGNMVVIRDKKNKRILGTWKDE